MIPPAAVSEELARSRQREMRQQAERGRLARLARSPTGHGQTPAGRLAAALAGLAMLLPVRRLRPATAHSIRGRPARAGRNPQPCRNDLHGRAIQLTRNASR
jgi:hypothetical protein